MVPTIEPPQAVVVLAKPISSASRTSIAATAAPSNGCCRVSLPRRITATTTVSVHGASQVNAHRAFLRGICYPPNRNRGSPETCIGSGGWSHNSLGRLTNRRRCSSTNTSLVSKRTQGTPRSGRNRKRCRRYIRRTLDSSRDLSPHMGRYRILRMYYNLRSPALTSSPTGVRHR